MSLPTFTTSRFFLIKLVWAMGVVLLARVAVTIASCSSLSEIVSPWNSNCAMAGAHIMLTTPRRIILLCFMKVLIFRYAGIVPISL